MGGQPSRGRQSSRRPPTYNFAKISPKLPEIVRIWDPREGAHPLRPLISTNGSLNKCRIGLSVPLIAVGFMNRYLSVSVDDWSAEFVIIVITYPEIDDTKRKCIIYYELLNSSWP